MDMDNNFDSDTSESWSLIDLNCERATDNAAMDEIGAEALETRLEEVENVEKCSASSGDKEENGSPENIISGNGGNIAVGNGQVKILPPFQALHNGPLFEDDSDSELYAPGGYAKYFAHAEKTEPGTKDVDEDTDGISVISESEFNEGKVNAYESDEISDEKPSDSDANENPSSSNEKKDNNAPDMSPGNSSGDNVNIGMAPEGSCSPKGIDAEKNENEKPRNLSVTPPIYRPNRNNRPGFASRLTMAIILSGLSYIILGYFCGEEDSLRITNNMAHTVRKLQKENLILHSRLTQLNRAVLAKGVKLDLREETEPPCLNDDLDCRKINLNPYERNMDEGNYDFPHLRNKDSLDFSIPLNHPKNVLAFKQILMGNEVFLTRKPDETFEPFNLSKYVEALVSGLYTEETPSEPLDIVEEPTKPMEMGNEEISESEYEEPGQKHEEREGINCGTDGSTRQGDGTRKDNCLAIEEKDMSQFRWFILRDKPKCTEIKVEDLEKLGPDCLYNIPMEEVYQKRNIDAFEDSDTAAADTDFFEGKDDEFIPGKTASASQVNSKSTHDRDYLEEKEPSEDSQSKKMKKPEVIFIPASRFFEYIPILPKKKGTDEKGNFDTGYVDKYLKYFEQVEKEIKENNGRTKECVMGKGRRCELNFKEPGENNQAQKENYKKNGEKRKNAKKGKKEKGNLRSKKLKTCNVKLDMRCVNDSKCDDCSCKTGDWFSKYAEGRQKCRRDQKISDWIFDRAKSREYSRAGDAFWQFSRADGRRNKRMSPYARKKKAKHFPGKGPGPKPDSQM